MGMPAFAEHTPNRYELISQILVLCHVSFYIPVVIEGRILNKNAVV